MEAEGASKVMREGAQMGRGGLPSQAGLAGLSLDHPLVTLHSQTVRWVPWSLGIFRTFHPMNALPTVSRIPALLLGDQVRDGLCLDPSSRWSLPRLLCLLRNRRP